MADITGGTIRYKITGDDSGLVKTLQDIESKLKNLAGASGGAGTGLKGLGRSARDAEGEVLRLAKAQARLAQVQGDNQQAANILRNALAGTTKETITSVSAQTQLQRVQNLISGQTKTLTGQIQGLTNSLGGLAAGFLVTEGIGFVKSLVDGANTLEKTKATVLALSGSQERYNEVISIATSQQKKFGGSLQENLEALGGFVNLSNRTGVELQKLENIARRLAIVDPVQGFSGASVALKEFFSGDITSLSKRFEIPRSVLNDIKNLDTYQEKADALDKVLNELGITQDVLINQTKTTAATYDQAAAQLDNAKNAIGSYIAELLKIPTQVVTEAIFKPVADSVPQLGKVEDQKQQTTVNFLTNAKDVAEFNKQVQFANQTLNEAGAATVATVGYFNQLTQAQFATAQAAVQAGTNIATIASAVNTVAPAIDGLTDRFARERAIFGQTREEVQATKDQLFQLAVSSEQGAQQAQLLIAAFERGAISLPQLQVALANIAAANEAIAQRSAGAIVAGNLLVDVFQRKAAAAAAARDEIEKQAQALQADAEESAKDAAEKETLKLTTERLTLVAQRAADALYASGQGATAAGIQALEASGKVDALTAAFLRLKLAQGALDAAKGVKLDGFAKNAGKAAEGFGRAAQAQQEYKFNSMDTAGQIKYLQGQLAGLSTTSENYWKTLDKIRGLQDRQARSGGGGAPKLSAEQKLNNSLLGEQEKYQDKAEQAELTHQQNILKIQQEYAQKQLAAQKALEAGKRASRFNFYKGLFGAEGIDQKKFAAEYEQAFAEAQQLAQQGKAKLAQEFLALRQQQIQDDIEANKERNELAKDDTLSKTEKNNRLKALDNLDKLRKDAQAEELKQLKDGGDANVNELTDKLADEEQRYANSGEKIALTAEQTADRRIAAWERANQKIASTPPAELAAFGGAVPGEQPITPPRTSAVTATAPASQSARDAAAGTSTDAAAQPMPDVLSVRLTEIAMVRDQGVIDSIADLSARLEGKLEQLAGTITGGNAAILGKLGDVASAVRSIRTNKLVGSG